MRLQVCFLIHVLPPVLTSPHQDLLLCFTSVTCSRRPLTARFPTLAHYRWTLRYRSARRAVRLHAHATSASWRRARSPPVNQPPPLYAETRRTSFIHDGSISESSVSAADSRRWGILLDSASTGRRCPRRLKAPPTSLSGRGSPGPGQRSRSSRNPVGKQEVDGSSESL